MMGLSFFYFSFYLHNNTIFLETEKPNIYAQTAYLLRLPSTVVMTMGFCFVVVKYFHSTLNTVSRYFL